MRRTTTFFLPLFSLFSILLAAAPLRAAPGFLDRSFGAGFGYVRFAESTGAVGDAGSAVAVQAGSRDILSSTLSSFVFQLRPKKNNSPRAPPPNDCECPAT